MRRLIAIALGVALAGLGTVALAARNSSGTYSRPSGNPVTTLTSITSSWANTLTSDLATELTDSLSRSGKGGMLAPLRATDGSVSLPSLSFTNDTDTGVYRIGSGNLGLSLNGTKYVDWASTLTSVSTPSYFGDAATFASSVTVTDSARFASSVTVSGFASFAEDATFLGSTFVPTPVTSIEAARKDYVDQWVGVVTTAYADFPARSTHACNVETVAGSQSIESGWDCVNATTGLTTEQMIVDSVYFVGTTGYVRWCTQTSAGDVDPAARTYRFRCWKAP